MRILSTIFILAALVYGGWRVAAARPDLVNKAEEVLSRGSFHTLEIRYTAEQIMTSQRKELLKDNRQQFLAPVLKFYPYLLLEVKYSVSDDRTGEGIMLWDLTDGEMVIDTENWEKTHGFADCIKAGTERHEFKILNILAKKGGISDRETLSRALRVENEILDHWIDNCRKKKLIVQSGNRYRLHLQNPRLRTIPETRITERLVTQPFKNALRAGKRYSISQIEKISKAAFGDDFFIRSATEIYLPIHSIVVENPDASIHTSYWNALSGKKIPDTHFLN
jgi:hypothetical protein